MFGVNRDEVKGKWQQYTRSRHNS